MSILSGAVRKAKLDSDQLLALQTWLMGLLRAHEYAKLGQGGHASNQIPLRRVFVDLPVLKNDNLNYSGGRNSFLEGFLTSPPIKLEEEFFKKTSFITEDDNKDNEQQFELEIDNRSDERGFLLIGGPGQGKSTLGQLACQLHRAALLKQHIDEFAASQQELINSFDDCADTIDAESADILESLENPYLPIQIALPDFIAWLAKESTLNHDVSNKVPALLRFLNHFTSAREAKLNTDTLLRIAEHIPLLVVLDGFDEVGAGQDRQKIVSSTQELLYVLSKSKAKIKLLATTRPQGYAGEFSKIGIPLEELTLTPLTKGEALEYARKLLDAKIEGLDEREKLFERVNEAAKDPSTERLMTTPLQVTILAALVQQTGRAPRERWNLFQKYYNYTFDREIERGTYASKLLVSYRLHIQEIHMRVALLLQVESEKAGGASARLPTNTLRKIIKNVLFEDGFPKETIEDLVNEIAIAASHRLVFLVEPEPQNVGFEIRSLQEFMAAWALTSGSEKEIGGRLFQISKAPMFRNVLLFSASRLFSENSHLRTMFTDSICEDLDSFRDIISGLTKAGATLALEILEEGAVLTQPIRAREMMSAAAFLLELPPSNLHSRLARVSNPDTILVLKLAIEQAISKVNRGKFDQLAGWYCLSDLVNQGETWALKLFEENWSNLKRVDHLLATFERLRFVAGKDLSDFLQNNVKAIHIPNLVDVHFSIDETSSNWISFISLIFKRFNRATSTEKDGTSFLRIYKQSARERIRRFIPQTKPKPSLEFWAAAASFEVNPTKETLALAIKTYSRDIEFIKPERSIVSYRFSWPLISAIRCVSSQAAGLMLANRIEAGEFGDLNDWEKAEQSWDRVEKKKVLTYATIVDPWNIQHLEKSPPFFSVNPNTFSQNKSKQKEEIVRLLYELLSIADSSQKRAFIVTCLSIALVELTKPIPDLDLNWKDLIQICPESLGLFVKKPTLLDRSLWRDILSTSKESTNNFWWYQNTNVKQIFNAISESAGNPMVIELVLRILTARRNEAKLKAHALSNVQLKAFSSIVKRTTSFSTFPDIHLGIVKTWAGLISIPDSTELLDSIDKLSDTDVESANNRTFIFSAYISALINSRFNESQIRNLLSDAFKKTSEKQFYSYEIVDYLLKLFQETKSGLDSLNIWRTLNLPSSLMTDGSKNEDKIPLEPVLFKSVGLKKIQGILDLTIDFTDTDSKSGLGQWIVLIGPNGIGKTTLLRSFVLALSNVSDPSIWPKGVFSNPWQTIGMNSEASEIEINLMDGQTFKTMIKESPSLNLTQTPKIETPRLFPVFAYGCRRGSALGRSKRELNLNEDNGPEVASLFDNDASLIHAETWILVLYGNTFENKSADTVFIAIIEALKSILDLEEISINDKTIYVKERNKGRVPFSCLSDGYLTNAGWLIDLIARWIEMAEKLEFEINSNFLNEMTGVVLIDEIDLHLHPKWQTEIITRTRKLFPKMTFIVTTHNPLTLVGARAEEIWLLSERDGAIQAQQGFEEPNHLTGGQLYKRYFDIGDIYPSEIGRAIERVSFLSTSPFRSDDEEHELEDHLNRLKASNIEIPWEIMPRKQLLENQ